VATTWKGMRMDALEHLPFPDREDAVCALRDNVMERIAAALPPDVVAAMGPKDLVAKAIAEACLAVAANVLVANRRGVPFDWPSEMAVKLMCDMGRAAMRRAYLETFGKPE
jgi:hypothetical protein